MGEQDPDSRKKQIVIADDNKSVLFYYKGILEDLGLQLHLFTDGKQVVDFITENSDIDLVILDIRMPVMDGMEAVKKIKLINPKLKVVAQSAFAMKEQTEEFMRIGFSAYFTKPIEEEDVLKLLA